MIREDLGLTEFHTNAISKEETRRLKRAAKRRNVTVEELIEKYPKDVAKIEAGMSRYAAQRKFMRAKMIARTELASAASRGQNIVWDKAIETNLLRRNEVTRMWITAGFDVDVICQDLAGSYRSFDGGATFEGGYMEPPAHPNCRCSMILVETPKGKLSAPKPRTKRKTTSGSGKAKSKSAGRRTSTQR
jgi:hypothetical protein